MFCLYFSYREQSDNGTDSEDVIEWKTEEQQEAEKNDKETIEKVIMKRTGRKGG